ncbi:hypothetical protein [Nannocystis pusilla]
MDIYWTPPDDRYFDLVYDLVEEVAEAARRRPTTPLRRPLIRPR